MEELQGASPPDKAKYNRISHAERIKTTYSTQVLGMTKRELVSEFGCDYSTV